MKHFLAMALLLAPVSALAQRQYHPPFSGKSLGSCPRVDPVQIGGTQGYADGFRSGKCYVSIQPTNTRGLVYRAYSIFSDGLIMVFSSYGDGQDSNPNLTSAREYFFFPRRAPLELRMDEAGGAVSVRMTDGGVFHFEPATAQLSSLERGSLTVSPRVDPSERGGVEITSYAGLVLDAGFRMGESPSGRPESDSTFRDAQGHLCTIKNRELFNYANGDHEMKFTDAQLSTWLATRCPAITPGF